MPRTLIAGGTGFIGQRLAEMLHAAGHNVTALGMGGHPCPRLTEKGIQVHFADLTATPLTDILADTDFDHVINLAGYIDHRPISHGGWDIFEAHTHSTLALIRGLAHDGHWGRLGSFIQIGSSDEYGNTPPPQHESQRENPLAPYALGKLTNTHLIQSLVRDEGFPGIVVRPFLVYGPGQSAKRLIPFIIGQCLENNLFDVSKGEQLRDFLYIDDFCGGIISLLGPPNLTGQIFNIASGDGIPVRRVIETVIELIGKGRANFGAKPYRTGESMALYADITAIKTATGWRPSTPLENGLRHTIDAIKAGL